MKKEKATIFEVLLKNKVCFAVSVSTSTFKNPMVRDCSKDYFIFALEDDFSRLKKHGFSLNKELSGICERDLSQKEIDEFKTLTDGFTKVLHNKHGRVYELKDNSFKAKYNELKG
jgi:hypothetical protein